MSNLILASKSKFRASLLSNAGVEFDQISSQIDEREIEGPLVKAGTKPAKIGEQLAIAKAISVSKQNQGNLIIGCDQILEFENKLLHKPKDMDEAAERLGQFSGKFHKLHSAICLVRNNKNLWSETVSATIKFRNLNQAYIKSHLAQAGPDILSSVGAYQIEGIGVQLFEKIEGDYFTIMGLPLIPLLEQLRKLNIIES